MGFFGKVKAVFLQADLFYSSEILKYRNETQYKTFSGAIFSLMIIAAIVTGFSSMIISTVERTSITSNLEVRKSQIPEPIRLKPGNDNFMFGLFVTSMDLKARFDLKNGPQIFEFKISQMEHRNGVVAN